MSNVDKRVVEMQFDNKQFESNIQTSVKSLDTLKKSLDLEKSARGLNELAKAGRSFSLDGIGDGVATISSRFTAMGIAGVTALQEVTRAAMNCGKQMINALTIDPVKSGFEEYETQINAIQTILANTSDAMDKAGKSQDERLEIVNDRLNELNTYADKTIYNFTQMTRNIGTFTAAGVELDTSVEAIKGIANLAAVSGANSQQASTAMYQLSQALASGTVKLQDWNSVVNASMGGELFQKALIRTAEAMGVTIDKVVTTTDKKGKEVKETVKRTVSQIIEDEGSFRESLKKGWLTSDVLTETLSQFAMDFEEIAKAQNITIEAAKELKKAELLAKGYSVEEADEIINLAETANDAATKVKTLSQLFDTLKEAAQSGWTQSWMTIIGDFNEAKELLTGMSDYFSNIINASAESRNAILADWKAMGGRNELVNSFWNVVYSIENVVRAVKKAFENVFPPTTAQQLYDVTKKFSDLTARIRAFTEDSEAMGKLSRVFNGVAAALDIVKTALGWVWTGFKKLIGAAAPATGGILEFAAKTGDAIDKLRTTIKTSETIQKVLAKLGAGVSRIGAGIRSVLGKVGDKFNDVWGKIRSSGVLEKIKKGAADFIGRIPEFINQIKAFGKSIVDYVKKSETLKTALNKVGAFFNPVISKIKEFGAKLKEAFKMLFAGEGEGTGDIWRELKARFAALGELFARGFETVKSAVGAAWEKIKEFFENFFTETMPEFFSWIGDKASGILGAMRGINWGALIKTILGLFSAIKFISFLSAFSKIGNAFKKLSAGVNNVGECLQAFRKEGLKITKQNKDSIGTMLLKIAASIGILVAAMLVLSKMDTGEIVKSLSVIALLGAELTLISLAFKKGAADGKGFLMMSAAIALMIIPIKMLAGMETGAALKGILGIGLIMAEMALFTRIAQKGFSGKTAFVSMAVGVNLLAIALKQLSKLTIGGLLQGLVGLGALLLEISLFMKAANGMKTTGLLSMAIAVNLMAIAIRSLGNMDTGALAKGLIAIGGMMAALSLVTKTMGGGKIQGSLVMLLSTAGMLILFVNAFKQIEGIDANSMLSFAASVSAILLTLAGSMLILGNMPITGSLMGIANLAIAIAGVAGIIIALGALKDAWAGMTDFLEAGGDVLQQIGAAIGKFFGGIGSGFVEGLDLPSMGTQLSAFMENAQPFLEGAKKIDESAANGVKNLASALMAIAGEQFVSSLVSIFTGENPVTKFSADIKQLGAALAAYGTAVAPLAAVPDGVIDKSITIAQALTGVAKEIPPTGPLAQFLNGTGDMTAFGSGVKALGAALVDFATEVSGIDDEKFSQTKIDALVAVAAGLASLETQLEGQGGLEDIVEGTKSLATFGEGFSPFTEGLNEFIKDVGGLVFDEKTDLPKIDAVISIAGALSALEKDLEAQGGITDAIEGVKSLSKFSEGFNPFAENLNGFIDQVKQITYDPEKDSTKMDGVIALATALAELENNLQAQGGLADKWSGVKSLGVFATSLPDFSTGLNSFITAVSQIKDEEFDQAKIDAALNTADAINEINNKLPKTAGAAQGFLGTKDLSLFSENMKKLGEALGSFAGNITNVNAKDSEKALNVMTLITDFISELDREGGLWQKADQFFGGSSAENLLNTTETMAQVGANLNAFATSISEVKFDDKVDTAAGVFKAMQDFIGGLETSGGAWNDIGQWFGGGKENTLTSISNVMGQFGEDFRTFSEGIANSDSAIAAFESAKALFNNFKTFNSELAGEKGGGKVSRELYTIGSGLVDFGTYLGAFAESITGIDATNLAGAASAIETLVRLAGDADGVDPSAVQNIAAVLEEYGNADFTASGDALGGTFVAAIAAAIQNEQENLSIAAYNAAAAGSDGAEEAEENWYVAGQNLAIGLANGILAEAASVAEAAASVADAATSALQSRWDEHSPSRVAMALGRFFDYGLAQGLSGYSQVVSDNAANVGREAVESARTMLSGFSMTLDGMDTTPTIRPVLDMSGVQDGVSAINGMFAQEQRIGTGMFQGMAFNRGADALQFNGAQITGSVNNRDVVDELRTLREQFDGLSSAVTSMNLVLDTGVLVGQTSAAMDRQLGMLASRRERGN